MATWNKFVEGVAIGSGLAVGLLIVAVAVSTLAPGTLINQRAALFGR